MPSQKPALLALFLAILSLVGVGTLGYMFWQQKTVSISAPSPTSTAKTEVAPTLPNSELKALETRISQLEKQATAASPVTTHSTSTKKTTTTSPNRESLLYIGSGNTIQRDWTVISGATVTLDTTKYGRIKDLRFEAGLSAQSDEVYARLIDAATQTPIYSSEVKHNLSTAEWKVSAALPIPTQPTTYTVEIRSSSGEIVNLVGSRLKVITD